MRTMKQMGTKKTGRILNDSERCAWLRLARTENVGPATFALLIARFPDPREALDAAPHLARRGGGKTLQICSEDDAKRELATLEKLGGRLIAHCEPEFPKALAALDPPPPVIAVLGHISLFEHENIAVVGARNASALGLKLAARIATDLGAAGLNIVSGLARGIDSAAHQASIKTGTIAVVADGIDVVYPPENQKLYEAIRAEGAIVSEMPPGVAPQARHFPRRNRIISGLARGTVVIEAAARSGSLITAHFALEQGREVFAVPGSPLDPRAHGGNRLIRDGATLTESAEDILSVLRPMLGQAFEEPPHEDQPPPADTQTLEDEADRVRALVEEKLSPAPVAVDELIRQCEAPAQAVLTVLLELELAGRIARYPGHQVAWA
jgi:DNA processing protein